MAKLPKKHIARQYGALPFRWVDDRLEVMLITSRDTGRWIIPKGWPIEKLKPRQVALVEAYEEAGLRGKIAGKKSLGRYRYPKAIEDERPIDCEVTVFALRVDRQLKKWPEKSQRDTRWFSPKAAAILLSEPGLKTIVLAFPGSFETEAPLVPSAANGGGEDGSGDPHLASPPRKDRTARAKKSEPA